MLRSFPSQGPVFRQAILVVVFTLVCAACGTKEDPLVKSVSTLDELQYDAGVLLSSAEDLYGKGEYEQAATKYEQFLELHPTHRWAAHAQFKLAESYAHRIPAIGRDPAPAQKAAAAFERLLSTYPGSRYEEAARTELKRIRARLGQAEVAIGRFYLKRAQYPAAIARLRRVVDDPEHYPPNEDASYYLAVAYERNGQGKEADDAIRALLDAFPQSRYGTNAERLKARIRSGAS